MRRTSGWAAVLDGGPLRVLRSLDTATADDLAEASADYHFRGQLAEACTSLAARAYGDGDTPALRELHATLALIYERDFSAVVVPEVDRETQPILRDVAALLERAMLSHELSRIPQDMITGYPESPADYVRWLKALVGEHSASRHPLYHEYLKHHGDCQSLRLLLAQETNLDPRFDDILAVMQIGRSGSEKMEMAANYWDEMGNGSPDQVHTTLFRLALDALAVDDQYIRDAFLLEASISGNLSACLALSRRHYYKAVGYFGATEYLAPRRFRCLVDSWRRAGLDEAGAKYHDLHIGIDAVHAAGWFKNVVKPLVARDPQHGQEIAIGTLMRLNTSADYLDAVLDQLRGRDHQASPGSGAACG
jgi:hypothetical protein